MAIVGTPGTSVNIEFKSDTIKTLNKDTNTYESNYSFKMKINFRNCTAGEEINVFNSLTECKVCEAGQYSYNTK